MMKRFKNYVTQCGKLAFFPLLILSCTSEQVEPAIDCTTSPLIVTVGGITDTNCGEANGSFVITVSGGETPYTFNSDLGTSADGTYSSIAAGNYSVEITDAKGCSEIVDVNIKNTGGVNVDNLIVQEAGCGTNLGSIQVVASGGEEPYTFALNEGTPQGSNIFSGLIKGSYNLAVSDALGCETTQTVELLSGVSYENSIKSIIATNCAISGCHNGSVSPNLTTFSNIQSSASRIKARTANRSMPQGRTLTQTQIDMIACWVDDGALNN